MSCAECEDSNATTRELIDKHVSGHCIVCLVGGLFVPPEFCATIWKRLDAERKPLP